MASTKCAVKFDTGFTSCVCMCVHVHVCVSVCVHMCVFFTQVVMVLHSSLGQPQVIRIGDWWEGGTSSVIRTHFRGPRLSVLKGSTLTLPLNCVTMCFHSIKLSYCDRDHLSNGALYKNIHINIMTL